MSPKNILVIGASRGIGLGVVQQLATVYPSAHIFATERSDPSAIKSACKAFEKRLTVVNLEVTSKESFDSVVQEFSKLGINSFDQVFYISGVLKGFGNILEVGIDVLKENIDVNLYGAYLATQAFVPFLEKSSEAKLSYISTDFASFALPIFEGHSQAFGTEGYDPTGSYNISKTALNRLGHEFHGILKPKGIAVLLIDPGQVKTDLNPWGQIEIEESAMGIVQVTGKFRLEDDRYFVKYNGTPLPW